MSETGAGVASGELPLSWETRIANEMAVPPPASSVQTFYRGPFNGVSGAVCVRCSDGKLRVIKGQHAGGRMLFNDQIIARLGQCIGAPVPIPALVNLTPEFQSVEARVAHWTPGLCHGSQYFDGHGDRLTVQHHDLPENRARFASLAILYGWMYASDHQQIYPDLPPPLVLSVDHGHFIGNGDPEWTVEILEGRPAASYDQFIQRGANLTAPELADAAIMLREVDEEDIANAVGAPPEEWGVSLPERVALAHYLWKRRGQLLQATGVSANDDGTQLIGS